MKVLVTDGEYSHSLGIVRYLGKEKIDVHVVSSEKKCITFYSKFCRKKIIAPVKPMSEDRYIDFIRAIVSKEKYDLLMPVGFQTTKIIARHRSELEEFTKIELASYESIEHAMNKRKTYETAEKMKIPFPRTVYPKTFDDVEKISYQLDFPVVIKGLYEAGKQVIAYPKNRDEFILNYYAICKEDNFKEGSLPMVQEFIGEGGNECLAALYQNGTIKKYVVYKAIRCFPVKGGASSCAITFQDEEIFNKGTQLLNELRWHGIADVEFKRDKSSGTLKLMEINPKFYATVEVAMRAGVNFPYYLCQMAKGVDLKFSRDYQKNLIYNYPFSKELIHLKEKPGSFFSIIADVINPKVKANIWLSDFKANLFELFQTIGTFLPSKIKLFFKKVLRVS